MVTRRSRRPSAGSCLLVAVGVFSLFWSSLPATATAHSTDITVDLVCEGEVPLCNPPVHVQVVSDGALGVEVATAASNCVPVDLLVAVDGVLAVTSGPIGPGASTGVLDAGPVSPGPHTVSIEAHVPDSDACAVRQWAGVIAVDTGGVASTDSAVVAPGSAGTASTVVYGSPGPGGVTATLFRDAGATGAASLTLATYAGLPSGIPGPPPIRAAAYLDLFVGDADGADRVEATFVPPNPIYPTDPVVPPNPVYPTDPIVPPNPFRLAYWSGSAWAPVWSSGGALPSLDAVGLSLSAVFDATSVPAVTTLGGTVFALVPAYYLRGFGTPVSQADLNVAKAGRAIPLKWQLFDFTFSPVTDLDAAAVRVSSAPIACEGSGVSGDAIEEYATGSSGLQLLADGSYQNNWQTAKSYAGSCRRLRLDVGERNPDGSIFYRMADFRFTR